MGVNGHLYKVLPVSKNFGTNFVHLVKNEYILLCSKLFKKLAYCINIWVRIHMAYGSGQPPLEYGLIFIGIWAVATYFSLSYPWEKLFYQKVSSTRTWIFLSFVHCFILSLRTMPGTWKVVQRYQLNDEMPF